MSTPPIAKQLIEPVQRLGASYLDPWHWLRDRDDPDTIAYLEAENAYSAAWFADRSSITESIFNEIKSRTLETDLSVPVRWGPWWYVTRTEEGASYAVHCRRPELDADDVVILDENREAEDHEYFSLGVFDVSPDHRLLAWAADFDGGERHVLRFRDLDTGSDLDDVIEGVYYSGAWAADNATFFYVTCDEAMRPHQVWRHRLASTEPDVCVFTEPDERFFLQVESTRSEAMLLISIGSKITSECWFLAADNPTGEWQVVRPRTEGCEYSVDHHRTAHRDEWIITTNDDAPDFRVMTAPVADPANWTELVPHEAGRRVRDVSAFAEFLVMSALDHATDTLTIIRPDGHDRLTFDEPVHAVGLGSNPDYATTVIRFGYQSMITPSSVYDHDVITGERTLRKQQPVLGVDLSRYRTRREWATAPDGARVPIDLAYRDDTALDSTAPALVYGYGSYETSIPPYFSIPRLSLMDRGMVFALIHPRGGGEMGRQWYLDGKLLNKRNTFTDTVACAEHLGTLVDPTRLVLRGGSAGGLLVGACLNLRPDLWAGAVAEVPFVDVVSTMLDTSMPLTVTEWEEWGNPAEAPYGDYMLSYSPYDNVQVAPYPAIYASAGLNDPRVSYHEPAKWVAKLRATTTGDAPILLHTEMGAGHGGPSGRYDAWRDEAKTLAFVLWTVGLIG